MRRLLDAAADVAIWLVIVVALVLLMVGLGGCATTRAVPCPPSEVSVIVPVPPQPLPLPAVPEWQTPATDPTDPVAYLQAMTADLLDAWAYAVELKHVITAHNEAVERTPE